MSTDHKPRLPRLAIAIAVIVLFGAGAYYVTGPLKCQGLEEDYLNSVSALKSSYAIRAVDNGDGKLRAVADRLDEDAMRDMQSSLAAIYEDCGERAGQFAFRKATELLGG